ncbi:hypothetical protein B0H21DRAFT_759318 [Amylocystis lapponica]|nr:hypothetical protein B0H21DRAFT_759318 [Amylocystis lapponica]
MSLRSAPVTSPLPSLPCSTTRWSPSRPSRASHPRRTRTSPRRLLLPRRCGLSTSHILVRLLTPLHSSPGTFPRRQPPWLLAATSRPGPPPCLTSPRSRSLLSRPRPRSPLVPSRSCAKAGRQPPVPRADKPYVDVSAPARIGMGRETGTGVGRGTGNGKPLKAVGLLKAAPEVPAAPAVGGPVAPLSVAVTKAKATLAARPQPFMRQGRASASGSEGG